MFSIYQ